MSNEADSPGLAAATAPPGRGARLLWWSDTYWPFIGGIEVLGEKLLARLANRGFEIVVLTSDQGAALPREEARNGIRIRRLPFHAALRDGRSELHAAIVRDVRELKRSFRPGVVHVNFPGPSALFHLLTRDACQAPTLASVQTALPSRDAGPDTLMVKMLRASSWIVANSEAMLDQVRAAVPGSSDRSSVLYYGLETPDLEPAPLDFEPPRIVCVGRLVEKKGMDVAIRAFAMLRQRVAGARLVIAGDGPERAALQSLASQLGLAEAVTFRGWVHPSRVREVMNQASLVLVPSRRMEPFGIVALEAMQMARPVIVTDQGGLPEVIEDGETGFVVPAEDSRGLADAAIRVLENPALARRLGQAGRERALRLFSLERYAREYEELCIRLAGWGNRAAVPG